MIRKDKQPEKKPAAESEAAVSKEPSASPEAKESATGTPSPSETGKPGLRIPRLDYVLVSLVLLLAVLLASSAIRNTGSLQHLATGRGIVQGDVSFGTAPFTYAASGYWTNHAWLFDVISYGIYSMGAAPAVILFKALCMAVLAWLMIRTAQAGPSPWIPAICVMVGLVTLSNRVYFYQPGFISYLFLGATIWLLERGSGSLYQKDKPKLEQTQISLMSYWPILPLFMLWSNLDEWFFFGPLTVLLYLLGGLLQPTLSGDSGKPPQGKTAALAQVLGLGLVACVINPHHVHVFELPTLLTWESYAQKLAESQTYRFYFRGAFSSEIFGYLSPEDVSVAHVSFFVLIFLTLLSFVVNRKRFQAWTLLLWATFLGLAVLRLRLVPFFGIVGGIVAAKNFHESAQAYVTAKQSEGRKKVGWALYGRCVTCFGLVILLLVAWPGWIHSSPRSLRDSTFRLRVALRMELSPSLEAAALQLQKLQDSSTFQGEKNHVFTTSSDAAHFLAWHCPKLKTGVDNRFRAFIETREDFERLRNAVIAPPYRNQKTGLFDERPKLAKVRRESLQKNRINCVVLHEQNPNLLAFEHFKFPKDRFGPENGKKQWTLLYLGGNVAVYGSLESQPQLAGRGVDLEARAYWPKQDSGERPPYDGPSHLKGYPPFWDQWVKDQYREGVDADEAQQLVEVYSLSLEESQRRQLATWKAAMGAGAIGFGGPTLGAPVSVLPWQVSALDHLTDQGRRLPESMEQPQQMLLQMRMNFLVRNDNTPVHYLYLAIHAARRAIAQNPNDANAYLHLGRAYLRLRQQSWEQLLSGQLRQTFGPSLPNQQSMLGGIRELQALGALRQAVALDDSLIDGHLNLMQLYGAMSYAEVQTQQGREERVIPFSCFDLYVHHLGRYLTLLREQPPPVERDQKEYERFQEEVAQFTTEYESRLKLLNDQINRLKTSTSSTTQNQALQAHELGLSQLAKQLLESVKLTSLDGRERATLTLLRLRLGDWEAFYDETRKLENLDLSTIVFWKMAVGSYKEAELALAQREGSLQPPPIPWKQIKAETLGELLLAGVGVTQQIPVRILSTREAKADLAVLRGLIAVEAGQPEHAEKTFQQAIDYGEVSPVPRLLAQDFLKRLKRARQVQLGKQK